MKILVKAAAAVGLLALAACNNTATENKADAIEANGANVAENLEEAAENMTNDQAAEATENKADAVRESTEEKADAVREGNGSVESNVSGM
ncbi:hypothetical protein [Sphingosinicella sp. YJ22]|uniref:hypothetical protein n=1 Tax=Sphingosinicella sp. YJ22 TaxID=1104780 RepID=UPI001409BAB3|nr:hypothetical protein [Sphingosinicella sp. YJ22]